MSRSNLSAKTTTYKYYFNVAGFKGEALWDYGGGPYQCAHTYIIPIQFIIKQ